MCPRESGTCGGTLRAKPLIQRAGQVSASQGVLAAGGTGGSRWCCCARTPRACALPSRHAGRIARRVRSRPMGCLFPCADPIPTSNRIEQDACGLGIGFVQCVPLTTYCGHVTPASQTQSTVTTVSCQLKVGAGAGLEATEERAWVGEEVRLGQQKSRAVKGCPSFLVRGSVCLSVCVSVCVCLSVCLSASVCVSVCVYIMTVSRPGEDAGCEPTPRTTNGSWQCAPTALLPVWGKTMPSRKVASIQSTEVAKRMS